MVFNENLMKLHGVIDTFFETYHYHILIGAFILGGIGAAMLFWGYINEIEEESDARNGRNVSYVSSTDRETC